MQQKMHIGKNRSEINQLDFSMHLQLAKKPKGVRRLIDGIIRNKNLLKIILKQKSKGSYTASLEDGDCKC